MWACGSRELDEASGNLAVEVMNPATGWGDCQSRCGERENPLRGVTEIVQRALSEICVAS
jgi:hypothetical protein